MATKEQLTEELRALLDEVKGKILAREWDRTEGQNKAKWDEMVNKASELHKLVNPTHHQYMIDNRGCSPDDREFYNHIHPIEDLLAFIDDPTANDDPEDITIGQEFELKVYSRRWGHEDVYKLTRTESGWELSHFSNKSAPCDRGGRPFLYENLNHDSINYPEALPEYLAWLWEQAATKGLCKKQVQDELDLLSNWIVTCERNSPKGIWEHFK